MLHRCGWQRPAGGWILPSHVPGGGLRHQGVSGGSFRARARCPWRDLAAGCLSKPSQVRAMATRYDNRERIYHCPIGVALVSTWLLDPVP
jgi:hypothetical protein